MKAFECLLVGARKHSLSVNLSTCDVDHLHVPVRCRMKTDLVHTGHLESKHAVAHGGNANHAQLRHTISHL